MYKNNDRLCLNRTNYGFHELFWVYYHKYVNIKKYAVCFYIHCAQSSLWGQIFVLKTHCEVIGKSLKNLCLIKGVGFQMLYFWPLKSSVLNNSYRLLFYFKCLCFNNKLIFLRTKFYYEVNPNLVFLYLWICKSCLPYGTVYWYSYNGEI